MSHRPLAACALTAVFSSACAGGLYNRPEAPAPRPEAALKPLVDGPSITATCYEGDYTVVTGKRGKVDTVRSSGEEKPVKFDRVSGLTIRWGEDFGSGAVMRVAAAGRPAHQVVADRCTLRAEHGGKKISEMTVACRGTNGLLAWEKVAHNGARLSHVTDEDGLMLRQPRGVEQMRILPGMVCTVKPGVQPTVAKPASLNAI